MHAVYSWINCLYWLWNERNKILWEVVTVTLLCLRLMDYFPFLFYSLLKELFNTIWCKVIQQDAGMYPRALNKALIKGTSSTQRPYLLFTVTIRHTEQWMGRNTFFPVSAQYTIKLDKRSPLMHTTYFTVCKASVSMEVT